jgi:hypothetical protein
LCGIYLIRISLGIDLNAKLWWRSLRDFIGLSDLILVVTFLSREEKSNQKKTPVSRLTLRVAAAAGARGNSPAVGGLRQSACFNPSATSMLGAGQREIKN